MKVLTEKEILHIWEAGQNRPLWFRGMLILSQAFPELSKGQLADMSIGQRNYNLLKLRQRMVGATIDSLVHCCKCRAPMEFQMNVEGIFAITPKENYNREYSTEIEGTSLRFRALTSRDLAVIGENNSPETARSLLLKRCIIQAIQNGNSIDIGSISEEIVTELGNKMAETYDPHIEIRFVLECPTCKHTWSAVFDIVSFFWSEISTQAQRFLQETHVLARAYGWSEAEILSMNTARKHYYLELVS